MDKQDIPRDFQKLQNGSDIRGVALPGFYGEKANLLEPEAKALAQGFVAFLEEKTGLAAQSLCIAVGRDSRLTGPYLSQVVMDALAQAGCQVMDCKMASTPAMFMATKFPSMNCQGAIMITASHLPMNRNGMKFFDQEGGLQKADISRILTLATPCYLDSISGDASLPDSWEQTVKKAAEEAEDFQHQLSADWTLENALPLSPLMETYTAHLRQLICTGLNTPQEQLPLQGLHVAVDVGNGAGGFYALHVLAPLGATIEGSRYQNPDGTFPNHAPNPEDKDAIDDIREAVLAHHADLGIIFDTDVDRAAAVTASGHVVARNGIVALAAALLAPEHPGSTIVTDSITSTQLTHFLEKELGLVHYRYKRGYKNVINKALELTAQGVDCPLAIETSGHAALKENYFLDDGAYLATRIVIAAAQLLRQGKTLDDLLSSLEEPVEQEEVRMAISAPDFADYGDGVLQAFAAWAQAQPAPVQVVSPNYEGVRVDFGHGWCLLRKSLHDPLMPLNIESDVRGGVGQIAQALIPFLQEFDQLNSAGLKDL